MSHYNRYTNIIGNFEDYERTINVFKKYENINITHCHKFLVDNTH
jgi:hypothetical protein